MTIRNGAEWDMEVGREGAGTAGRGEGGKGKGDKGKGGGEGQRGKGEERTTGKGRRGIERKMGWERRKGVKGCFRGTEKNGKEGDGDRGKEVMETEKKGGKDDLGA